jgi:hypothetical protein
MAPASGTSRGMDSGMDGAAPIEMAALSPAQVGQADPAAYASAINPQAGQDGSQATASTGGPVSTSPHSDIVAYDNSVQAEPLAPRAGTRVQPDARALAAAPAVNKAPSAVSPAAFAAAVDGRALMSADDMGRLLAQAGLKLQGAVETVKTGSDMVAYSWDTGALYGSAEQQPMGGMGQFDGLVKTYLDKTASRCTGEFGAIPGVTEDRNGARVATYEIACVTDGGGATAAMVFMARDGLFTAVAHETGMESMDIAMDVRDAVYASLLGTRLAAR